MPISFFMPSESPMFLNPPSLIPPIYENLPLPACSLLSFRDRSVISSNAKNLIHIVALYYSFS